VRVRGKTLNDFHFRAIKQAVKLSPRSQHFGN